MTATPISGSTHILESQTHEHSLVKRFPRRVIEIKDGMVKIEQRNKFSVGETIEIMKPNGDNVEVQVKRIVNEEGEEQESAPHPKQVLYVELSGRADKYDILRRKEEADE